MQCSRRFDIPVLALLLLRREHEPETIRLVECERDRLVVGVDHQVTATRLVVRIDKPLLDVVKKFAADTPVLKGIVHPKTPDENRRINQVTFFPRELPANQLFPRIRKVIRKYARIRDCKRADNIPQRSRIDKRIRLPHQLTAVIDGIIPEKRIKVLVATGEMVTTAKNRRREHRAYAARL